MISFHEKRSAVVGPMRRMAVALERYRCGALVVVAGDVHRFR
jgi:hypothetical protein